MGNPFKSPKPPPPDPKLEAEMKAAEEQAAADKAQDEKETAQLESKKRRGLIGIRSLFGRAGGRGYFETV